MYVEISDSDLVTVDNEEDATHGKIVDKLMNLPVTVGGIYELFTKRYGKDAPVEEEQYIVDDNGKENHSFWMCSRKQFYKKLITQK